MSFPIKSLKVCRIGCEIFRQQLKSDFAAELCVQGTIDNPHAAGAELAQYFIVRDHFNHSESLASPVERILPQSSRKRLQETKRYKVVDNQLLIWQETWRMRFRLSGFGLSLLLEDMF